MIDKTEKPDDVEDLWSRYGSLIKSRRKAIWLIFALGYLIAYFHRVSPAVIVDKLFSQFSIEAAAVVGSMSAVYFYIYFLMQIPAGILTDIFGPRKVLFCGLIVSAAGAVWFALAGSVGSLFAGRFLVGLGVSVVFVCAIRAYSSWFRPREFGTVMGMMISVGNLGGVMAAAPLAALVDLLGWRSSFAMVGLASLLLAAAAWRVVRDHPADVLPAGRGAASTYRPQPVSWADTAQALGRIVRDRNLWLALTASFCIYGPFMALVGVWGVPFLMQVYGMARTQAASVMILASLGVMVGGLTMGLISDRLGSRKKPYVAFAVGNVLVWAALVWWNQGMPPVYGLLALYFLLGIGGNTGVLSPIMIKEYNPPQYAGLASGLGNIGGFVGSAFMQPFFGLLLDRKWDGVLVEGAKHYSLDAYHFAFTACLISGCLAVLMASLLKESLRKSSPGPGA